MTNEQENQWREEFEKVIKYRGSIRFCNGVYADNRLHQKWIGFKTAKRIAQEEIDKLINRNTQLEDFCNEFVYGEENPKYYSTMIDKLAKKDEIIKELKRLYFYAEEMNYSIDDYQGISGEMRSRCVLYSDMEERNDCYRYAGRLAREVKKKIEELEDASN